MHAPAHAHHPRMLYVFFFLFFMSGGDTLCHPLPQHNTTHARTRICTLAALKCGMSFFMSDGDTRTTSSLNTTQRMHAHVLRSWLEGPFSFFCYHYPLTDRGLPHLPSLVSAI